ncbi:DNA sulfur modification protein DndB [Candidatus Nitrosomarinus catalina]|uniref:DNA sulfur modification protein DndB n=1 Tax=Candidatus Nitrosomarinus catalinensis TaxID=1898749 RepID=A0A2Z2HLQ3_9ARCH|nr:DNA sulfur modification protein DndB [Candidatus Nitrosomarinus catalina]ARS64883.1 DNA sulfur modification protein DndB [Candidatus Nitrosomarinus catalina]
MSKSRIAEQSVGSETYGFDAIRGIQAKREFYVAMCPLKIIPKLFIFNDYEIPPELRAQRIMKDSRIPAIKNYILNNPEDYTFSSLTASVDGTMKFTPAASLGEDGKLGRLYINMDSRLLINDGQHRRKAIEEALKENPDLGSEMISVVFFQDDGLKRSQQMFSDLNKNAVKPTKSLNILYDHRDKFSQFIVDLVGSVDIFEGRVELEKTSISNRSTNAFTLNGIADASLRLIGLRKSRKPTDDEKKLIKEYWEIVSKNIPEWQLLIQGKTSSSELRKSFVHTNTNCLNAIGIAGQIIIEQNPDSWKDVLKNLKKIDWSRESSDWEKRLILNGQMQKHSAGIDLAANVILQKCGISLSEDRQKIEDKL